MLKSAEDAHTEIMSTFETDEHLRATAAAQVEMLRTGNLKAVTTLQMKPVQISGGEAPCKFLIVL